MAGVEGSGVHGGDGGGEENQMEELQFGWNEDTLKMDLEFKTGHKYSMQISYELQNICKDKYTNL